MLKITYILFSLSIGMIIGGFAFGNNTVGIIGVVLAIVDAIVGILMTYFRNKGQNAFSFKNFQATYQKLERLISNPYSAETFTMAELANVVVNLLDALQVLTDTEFFYLKKVYDEYQCDLSRITVTFEEYLFYCNKIISNYDMVVPYYKVCGSSDLNIAKALENDKQPYRQKAKILIDNNKLFSSEWLSLNLNFYNDFYNTEND